MILTGVFLLYLIGCECSNVTEKYMAMDERSFQRRKTKLITFNTEEDEITVDVEFAVPFIKIPVKKSLDLTKAALANINVGAMLLSGLMAVSVAVVIPTVFSFFNKKLFVTPHTPSGNSGFSGYHYHSYRNTNSDTSEVWRYLNVFDDVLLSHNIDTTSCMQRIICWTAKRSSKNVSSGKGSSVDKILDGLATNQYLQTSIANTPFHSALMNGLDDINCNKEYDKCKVTQRTINNFVNYFVKAINGG